MFLASPATINCLMITSFLYGRMLMSQILCSSCTHNHRCCEFKSIMSMQCPESNFPCLFPWLSNSFQLPWCTMHWTLGVGGAYRWCPIYDGTFNSHPLSLFWSAMRFCSHCYPLRKEVVLIKVDNSGHKHKHGKGNFMGHIMCSLNKIIVVAYLP